MKTIEIDNVGTITHLTIPLEPGVTVLAGRNGAGKSTALRAIGALATGEGADLEVRDGLDVDTRGKVTGLGATLVVGRRRTDPTENASGKNRGTGELEIRTLRGLNLLDLVSPGVLDPERADARRIALLCDLAQVRGGIELFAASLGDGVKKLASRKTLDADSVPEIASGLRRDIQAAARDAEAVALRLDGEIAGHLSASGGVDGAEPDVAVDHAAIVSRAVRDLDALLAASGQARKASEQAARARAELESARASFSGPTAEQAEAAVRETLEQIEILEREIRDTQSRLAEARAKLAEVKGQHATARTHEERLSRWSESIAAGESAVAVDPESIASAEAHLKASQEASSNAKLDAERRARRRKADELVSRRDEATRTSGELRDLATKCEGVVSEIVNGAGLGLHVRNGRLMVNTSRGDTLFADLSFGEGVRLAVEIAAKSFGREEALLVVPQEAFEGLDPTNQAELDAIARECGVSIVSARATDGELRVERFEGAA